MADLSVSFNPATVATSSDAASDAVSKVAIVSNAASGAAASASDAASKAGVALGYLDQNVKQAAGPTFDHIHSYTDAFDIFGGSTELWLSGHVGSGSAMSLYFNSVVPALSVTPGRADLNGAGGASLNIKDTTAAADGKYWRFNCLGTLGGIDLVNDAYSAATAGIAITRSGMTVSHIDLYGTEVHVAGGFGCNGTAPQTAYASGGALAAYAAGTNGFSTAGRASALYALVVAMRAALVANGIMS